MCEPVTLLTLGAMGISAGAGIFSGYEKGKAITAQGQADRSTAYQQAGYEDRAAADALQRGDQQAQGLQFKEAALKGEQLAQGGASGVDLQSHSLMGLITGSAQMGALDEATAKNNAAREAWGHKQQATNLRTAGDRGLARSKDEAFNTYLGSALQVAGGLASGGAGAYAGYQKAKKEG